MWRKKKIKEESKNIIIESTKEDILTSTEKTGR